MGLLDRFKKKNIDSTDITSRPDMTDSREYVANALNPTANLPGEQKLNEIASEQAKKLAKEWKLDETKANKIKYINEHPYAKRVDALIVNLARREKLEQLGLKANKYTGKTEKEIMPQICYDALDSYPDENAATALIPYLSELEKNGGGYSRGELPQNVADTFEDFKKLPPEQQDVLMEKYVAEMISMGLITITETERNEIGVVYNTSMSPMMSAKKIKIEAALHKMNSDKIVADCLENDKSRENEK